MNRNVAAAFASLCEFCGHAPDYEAFRSRSAAAAAANQPQRSQHPPAAHNPAKHGFNFDSNAQAYVPQHLQHNVPATNNYFNSQPQNSPYESKSPPAHTNVSNPPPTGYFAAHNINGYSGYGANPAANSAFSGYGVANPAPNNGYPGYASVNNGYPGSGGAAGAATNTFNAPYHDLPKQHANHGNPPLLARPAASTAAAPTCAAAPAPAVDELALMLVASCYPLVSPTTLAPALSAARGAVPVALSALRTVLATAYSFDPAAADADLRLAALTDAEVRDAMYMVANYARAAADPAAVTVADASNNTANANSGGGGSDNDDGNDGNGFVTNNAPALMANNASCTSSSGSKGSSGGDAATLGFLTPAPVTVTASGRFAEPAQWSSQDRADHELDARLNREDQAAFEAATQKLIAEMIADDVAASPHLAHDIAGGYGNGNGNSSSLSNSGLIVSANGVVQLARTFSSGNSNSGGNNKSGKRNDNAAAANDDDDAPFDDGYGGYASAAAAAPPAPRRKTIVTLRFSDGPRHLPQPTCPYTRLPTLAATNNNNGGGGSGGGDGDDLIASDVEDAVRAHARRSRRSKSGAAGGVNASFDDGNAVPCFREPHHECFGSGMSQLCADGTLARAYALLPRLPSRGGLTEPAEPKLTEILDRLAALYPFIGVRAELRDLFAAACFSTVNTDFLIGELYGPECALANRRDAAAAGDGKKQRKHARGVVKEFAPAPVIASLSAAQAAYRAKHAALLRREPEWEAELRDTPCGYKRSRWEDELRRRYALWLNAYLPASYNDALRAGGGLRTPPRRNSASTAAATGAGAGAGMGDDDQDEQQQQQHDQERRVTYVGGGMNGPAAGGLGPRHYGASVRERYTGAEDEEGGPGSGGAMTALEQLQRHSANLSRLAHYVDEHPLSMLSAPGELEHWEIAGAFTNFPVLETLLASRLRVRVLPDTAPAPAAYADWTPEFVVRHKDFLEQTAGMAMHQMQQLTEAERRRVDITRKKIYFLVVMRAVLSLLHSDYSGAQQDGKSFDDTGKIDLHGFSVPHAMSAVHFFLNRFAKLHAMRQKVPREVTFLVGRGSHSFNGARLPHAVRERVV